jgi:hypothetical protein
MYCAAVVPAYGHRAVTEAVHATWLQNALRHLTLCLYAMRHKAHLALKTFYATKITDFVLPFVAYNQGSIIHLETSGVMLLDFRHPLRLAKELKPRKHMMEEMGAAYMANGLVTLAGSRMYTSMADTDQVIDDALARFETVLAACA